ncbi:MAG: hypothetical protein R2710_24645 [Acidimicrobiales bacterium]
MYDDSERLKQLIATHATAQEKATELLEQWEQAALELADAEG